MWCGPCLHRRLDSTGGFLEGHQRRLGARCCLGAGHVEVFVEVFRHVEPVLQQIPALNGSRLHFSLFRLVKSSRTLHIQSPAGPRAQPPGCGPTTKGPGLAVVGTHPCYSMLADFRKCDNFYCQFVTWTWHLPKVCSESRLVDKQLVCSTGDLQCRVPVQIVGAVTVRRRFDSSHSRPRSSDDR